MDTTINRRNFMTGATAASLVASLGSSVALAAGPNAPTDMASSSALNELLAVIQAKEDAFNDNSWALVSPLDYSEARRALFHTVQHALQTWIEADPARPFFVAWHSHHKKILGDNPDARYYAAVISDEYRYRIRGNIAGAEYTSFTQELGVGLDAGLGTTMNDTEFATDAAGNYEIILSSKKENGNCMALSPGVKSLTTRHYYERKQSINNDLLHHIPITIENLDRPDAPAAFDDAAMARGIRQAAAFIDKSFQPPRQDVEISFVSRKPNTFKPFENNVANQSIGYAAKDNVYAMAPFVVRPNQGLVIKGQLPSDCRFASVVLYNRFLQTLDYEYRPVSLNREQIDSDKDGNFEIVISAKDPGRSNWISTQGRVNGIVYWRFLLPKGKLKPLETQLITLA